jgi:hypothetical protein
MKLALLTFLVFAVLCMVSMQICKAAIPGYTNDPSLPELARMILCLIPAIWFHRTDPLGVAKVDAAVDGVQKKA